MEKKLAEYRAKKKREAAIAEVKDRIKSHLKSFFGLRRRPMTESPKEVPVPASADHGNDETEPFIPEPDDGVSDSSSTVCDEPSFSTIDIVTYLLYFALWVTLYAIFIKLQFGTIYFIVSALVGMYLNTRTGPKKPNEISAYSVFNENVQGIDGTLTAEQLQREMLFGPAAAILWFVLYLMFMENVLHSML